MEKELINRIEELERRVKELEVNQAPAWFSKLRNPRPDDDRYQSVIFDGTAQEFAQAVSSSWRCCSGR